MLCTAGQITCKSPLCKKQRLCLFSIKNQLYQIKAMSNYISHVPTAYFHTIITNNVVYKQTPRIFMVSVRWQWEPWKVFLKAMNQKKRNGPGGSKYLWFGWWVYLSKTETRIWVCDNQAFFVNKIFEHKRFRRVATPAYLARVWLWNRDATNYKGLPPYT